MIRHIAVFRFVDTFSADQREAWMRMLRALPDRIPELRRLSVGVDVLSAASSHEIGLVADFADLDALAAYTRHPAHQEVLAISAGVKVSLATVDFECEDDA
ncbi:Dabb family protein [Microbacterium sp. NPDC091313]